MVKFINKYSIEFTDKNLNDKFTELLILLKLNNINYEFLGFENNIDFCIDNSIVFMVFPKKNTIYSSKIDKIIFKESDKLLDIMYQIIDYCINIYVLKKEIL